MNTSSFLNNLWIKIPVVVYSVGFFIHNIYLSSFSIYDFELVQARYLYVGVISLIIISFTTMLVLLKTDLTNYENNFYFGRIYLWFYRVTLFSLLSFGLLYDGGKILELNLVGVLDDNIRHLILLSLNGAFLVVLIMISDATKVFEGLPKIEKYSRIFIRIISPLFITSSIFMAYYSDEYREIFIYYIFILVGVMAFLFGLADSKYGIETDHLNKDTDKKTHKSFKFLVGSICLVVSFMSVLYNYSKNIYPNISPAMGGGKPSEATVKYGKKSLTGGLISESSKWVYVIAVDKKVVKIKHSSVDEIIIEVPK